MPTQRRAERVVRAWFVAFETQDMESARSILAEDAVLHSYGPPEVAGYVRGGLDDLLAWYSRKRRAEGPGFEYDIEEILGGDRFGVALLRLSSGQSERVTWRQVAVYRIENDRIGEIWLHEEPRPASD
ncbi:MAG: nuclear transport factor 2 family protein [Actinomycetota bacterium]